MDITKDYYAVLGVLPSIDHDALTAVYYALIKKFHPDVYQGSKGEAHRVATDLNEAYAILRDPEERSCYDARRTASARYARGQFESQYDANYASNALDKDQDEAWGYIVQYHPGAQKCFHELSVLSPQLALQYQITLIKLKISHDAGGVRDILEKEFLLRFFGDSSVIHSFVKNVLIKGQRNVVAELNKAIRIMGSPKDDAQAWAFIHTARKKMDNVDEVALKQAVGEARYAEIVSKARAWDASLSITKRALEIGVTSYLTGGVRMFAVQKYTSEPYLGAGASKVFPKFGNQSIVDRDLYVLVEGVEKLLQQP